MKPILHVVGDEVECLKNVGGGKLADWFQIAGHNSWRHRSRDLGVGPARRRQSAFEPGDY